MCPAWLKLSNDRNCYEIIEDRAAVIRSIFNDTVNGIGNYSITRRLNQQRVPHFGKSNGWHNSYVAKILNNRAVIGEFQPHHIDKGKRQPTGEPIKGYFPAIIDERLFYGAQASRAERLLHGRGRKGELVSNLFSGIATCAYCKSKMYFENKGAGPKGATFLVCDNAKRGLGCSTIRWRYDHFEASFLAFVQELDLEKIIRDDKDSQIRADLSAAIAALRGELDSIKQQQDRTYQLFVEGNASTDFVQQKLNGLAQRIVEIEATIKEKEDELSVLSNSLYGFYNSKDQIKSLISRLQTERGEEVYRLRSQIASNLRSLISALVVAPVGLAPLTQQAIHFLKKGFPEATDVVDYLKNPVLPERESRRYFSVGFKDGSVRAVYPNNDDPLQFEEQVLASKQKGLIRRLPESDEVIFRGDNSPIPHAKGRG